MVAYNHTWLNNLSIDQEAEAAFEEKLIDDKELAAIKASYPVGFYTPNPFIRFGLFILTVIIASLAFGLITLMLFTSSGEDALGGMLIFYAILCYIALEMMVQSKFHYRSGVDDALICMSVVFLISGLNNVTNISFTSNAIIILISTLYMAIRFADMLMSAVSFLALLATVFLVYEKAGPYAKASMPFLMIVVCLFIYFFTKKGLKNKHFHNYYSSLTLIEFLSLLCLYAAGNYFVVREAGSMMYEINLPENAGIPMGWLFWILTMLLPVAYIFAGLYKKDIILLRAGLILIAFTVFTVRYYYSVFPMEVPMTIGGALMILISYLFIRYLKEPKHGFTYKEASRKHALDKLNAEALIITGTMGTGPAGPSGSTTQFGGGSGGGAGATGAY